MKPAEIKARLNNRTGHSFLISGQEARFIDWELNDDNEYVLRFDNRTVVKAVPDLHQFLNKEMLKVDEPEPEQPQVPATESETALVVADILPNKNTMQRVNDALLDALDKVSKNPNYINQAKAVSEVSQTIFNGAKLQIDAAKLLQKSRK